MGLSPDAALAYATNVEETSNHNFYCVNTSFCVANQTWSTVDPQRFGPSQFQFTYSFVLRTFRFNHSPSILSINIWYI